MRPPDDTCQRPAALSEPAGLGGEDDRGTLSALRGRLRQRRLRVLVAGEAKRGKNPGNHRNLTSVTVVADAPVLARGVELVDTPGTGSVYAHNTAEAEAALNTMDAAVFVLTADPPVSASERELMARVAELSVTMFVVLNKADYLAGYDSGPWDAGESELAEALEFTARVTGEATGRPAAIYALSARAALSGGNDPGFAIFAKDFTVYLEQGREADLRFSVAAHARRMAGSLRDEAALARRAAQMRTGRAAERVEAFAARLAGLAVAAAETWRQQQAEHLEDGLARLDTRLTEGLRAELDAVRDAAADLLGLHLAVPGPGERLAPDPRFFYLVAGQAGQTELLAGAIRRWLPGEAGRRRARAYLRREAASLVPQQIGRARADLQYRLAGATRQLIRAVADRYTESTGRLEGALRTAAAARKATADDAARLDTGLAGRQQALDHVLSLLDEAAAAASQASAHDAASPGPGR